MLKRIRISHALALGSLGLITISLSTIAQTPTQTGPIMRFTATSANVSGAPDSVRFDVLAWSSDMDRDQMAGVWNLTVTPNAGARGAATGARGAGGGRGARGGAQPDAPDAANAAAAAANPPAAAGNAAAPAGRGGRGGGRGAAPAAVPDAAPTPEGALAAALQTARTVGYLWTSESAGYSLRYAYRIQQPDGGERIIFATDRRLGAWNDLWKPTGGAAATPYEFTVIELRLNAKGIGEGKTSLTGKVAIDASAKTIALDGYAALPIVFKDLKRGTAK